MTSELVFDMPGITRVFYEKDNELIILEWLDYNPDGQEQVILVIMQRIYHTLLVYSVEKIMVKADRVRGAFSPAIQDYLMEVQFPRIIADTKIQDIVTIMSQEGMGRASTRLWQKELIRCDKRNSLTLHNVTTETSARELLNAAESK